MLGLWPLPPRHRPASRRSPASSSGRSSPSRSSSSSRCPACTSPATCTSRSRPRPRPRRSSTSAGTATSSRTASPTAARSPTSITRPGTPSTGTSRSIIDTLELSEIPGLHHGTYREKMWWWHTLGYTPAGVECWNAMRALDYLETPPGGRSEADRRGRAGPAAGRTRGGSPRPTSASPVPSPSPASPTCRPTSTRATPAGWRRASSPATATACSWSTPTAGTSRPSRPCVAPRPLMLGNSDADDIFPVPGYPPARGEGRSDLRPVRGRQQVHAVYETLGKHEDTLGAAHGRLPLDEPLAQGRRRRRGGGEVRPLHPAGVEGARQDPRGADQHDGPGVVHPSRRPSSCRSRPTSIRSWWPGEKAKLEAALKEKVFRGWPARPCPTWRRSRRATRRTTASACGPGTSPARKGSRCVCG